MSRSRASKFTRTGSELEEVMAMSVAELEPETAVGDHAAGVPITSALTGRLIGFADGGVTPLVVYPGQPGTAALPARAIVDLHGAHVGGDVVLIFDGGDARRPIVVGWLRPPAGWPMQSPPGQVQVDADGERMIVSASQQLVLRCGSASITLTKAGKVIIRGAYIVSHSTGVNRVKGGTVHLN
jgi:hypothetical protein